MADFGLPLADKIAVNVLVIEYGDMYIYLSFTSSCTI